MTKVNNSTGQKYMKFEGISFFYNGFKQIWRKDRLINMKKAYFLCKG